MGKRRAEAASAAWLTVRVTASELAAYRMLAAKRGKTLPDMVRSGLNAVVLSVCLCAPGAPECLRCQAERSRRSARASAVPEGGIAEPRYVADAYNSQADPDYASQPDAPPDANELPS